MFQVPSGFLLTDALLLLDKTYGGKLLVPTADQTKEDLAAREARRIKKLLGALRHLFRNSACSKKVCCCNLIVYEMFSFERIGVPHI